MYYKLIAGQDIFELNPGLRAVPSFNEMTDMQMKFICLMCDPSNDNPVRTLEGKNKRTKAAILAGYKLESDNKRLQQNGRDIVNGKNKTIEEGFKQFNDLHYNEKLDTYESLAVQIAEIRDFLKSKKMGDHKKMTAAINLGVKLPELVEAKMKIENLLNLTTSMKPELDSALTVPELIAEETADESTSILDQVMKRK